MTATIEQLEARWQELTDQRLNDLETAYNDAPPALRLAVIQAKNADPYYERQFDALEEQIRALDPDHHLLAENQFLYN